MPKGMHGAGANILIPKTKNSNKEKRVLFLHLACRRQVGQWFRAKVYEVTGTDPRNTPTKISTLVIILVTMTKFTMKMVTKSIWLP